jgi:hypothetical protein
MSGYTQGPPRRLLESEQAVNGRSYSDQAYENMYGEDANANDAYGAEGRYSGAPEVDYDYHARA